MSMLNLTMFSSVHFFEAPQEISGFFDTFFGGLFLVKGLPTFFQIGFLGSLLLCLFASLQFTKNQKTQWEKLSAFSAFATLTLGAFLLLQPWDELFISLRHAQHLSESGNFSFNRFEKTEGIVDFFPFFILGLLNKLGLPLIETNFLMEILAGWFCILGGRQLLISLGVEHARVWSYPILVLYPPLLLNTGNGFAVLFFTAFIIWSVVFLIFNNPENDHWFLGCCCLALVPLVRLEGIWFSLLLCSWLLHQNKKALPISKILVGSVTVLLPIFILTVWRISYFGRAIPVPVIYKSSFGSLFFTLLGIRNFFLDLVAGGAAFFLALFIIDWNQNRKKSTSVLLILFLFSIPYYLSGGDWFPPAWGRYLFPFSFFCFVFGMSILSETWGNLKNRSFFATSLLMVIFIVVLLFPSGSTIRVAEGLFTPRASLAALNHKKFGRGNYRIHYLSRLGHHLKDTTTPQTIVGSSELATIMYFANREAFDLLGITNIEIATSPLRENPKLFSKVKPQNELPHLIFKRTRPDLLFKIRPGVFYAFDLILKDLIEDYHPEEITDSQLVLALQRWQSRFRLLNESLFGGTNTLIQNGYEPVLVKYGLEFVALYFVSSDSKDEHFSKMRNSGMVYSQLKNSRL